MDKCSRCRAEWHNECYRSHQETDDDGDEHTLCCCNALGLWFDEDGIERWPDGTMYATPTGHVIIDDLPPAGSLDPETKAAMLAWFKANFPEHVARTSWVKDDLFSRTLRGDDG